MKSCFFGSDEPEVDQFGLNYLALYDHMVTWKLEASFGEVELHDQAGRDWPYNSKLLVVLINLDL